jgi:hypothetical protein
LAEDGKESFDVVLLHSATEDGNGVRVIRARPDRVEAGEVRPVQEGKPLAPNAQIVKLKPRDEAPRVCDVEVQYAHEGDDAAQSRHGPAQVATKNFRDNWEAVFGKPS